MCNQMQMWYSIFFKSVTKFFLCDKILPGLTWMALMTVLMRGLTVILDMIDMTDGTLKKFSNSLLTAQG